jgi:hypothetical protein
MAQRTGEAGFIAAGGAPGFGDGALSGVKKVVLTKGGSMIENKKYRHS